MSRAFLSNLRLRFVILAVLGVLPALALLLNSASEQRDQAVDAAQDEAERFVRLAAADQERLIESSHQLLAVIARFPELRADDTSECQRLLSELIGDYPVYANIGVIEPDGSLRCSALPSDADVELGDRAYFERAAATGEFSVGDYQIGRITNQATINVAYPVVDNQGDVQEVFYAALNLADLNTFAAEAQLPEGSFLLVLDRNGTALVRHPDPAEWVGESLRGTPVVERILSGQSGSMESENSEGREYLYVFTPLLDAQATANAFIVLGEPREIVLEPANRAFNRNLGRLGVVGILAIVAAMVGGDLLARRGPENLKAVVRRFYDAFNSGNTVDIEEIVAHDFIDHHPSVGQASGVEGLRDLIARFRFAFSDGKLVTDNMAVDGNTVAAWVTLTGTQTGEFLGVPASGELVRAHGIETFRLDKGKIVESWSLFSVLQPAVASTEVSSLAAEDTAPGGDAIIVRPGDEAAEKA